MKWRKHTLCNLYIKITIISNKHCIKLRIFDESWYTNFIANIFSHHAGLPTELIEDSKFVPLNEEDPSYGPPVSHG